MYAEENSLQLIASSFDWMLRFCRKGVNLYCTLPKATTDYPSYPQYLKN